MGKRIIPATVRRICYERDEYTCQWDGCDLSRTKGDRVNLHHILPEQFGGKETPDNLITYCDIHHKNKHIEFHSFYPDSQGILYKMNALTKKVLSKIRKELGVDDGYDLRPYLYFLTKNNTFRTGQLKTIRAALAGKDVLFVSPTGSGKSVCYQMPGFLAFNPTLVVSPLKALMKDQVESIWSKKIPTTYVNSDINGEERKKRYEFIRKKLYKFIFVAPERFESRDPKTAFLYNKYSYLVIDEAHEIEMWGMAFRPSYRKLGTLRERLGNPPIIAMTATASKETQDKILESLNIQNAEVVVTGFYRSNIKILIHESGEDKYTTNKLDYVNNVIKLSQGQKILIFVPTIKSAEELLDSLRKSGTESELYHSKLDKKAKMKIQNKFNGSQKPELNVLISTSAFGMGINISNIRHVIHLSPALSITDYTQQIGRAGRDGLQSYAHLLYGPKDKGLLEFMAELPLNNPNFKDIHQYDDNDLERVRAMLKQQVNDMYEFIKQPEGKEWQYILDYFGEVPPSFWEQNGKIIIDIFIGLTIMLSLALIIKLLKG